MRGYWSETRANGQPIDAGTFAWVTDLQDGTHPIYTYGKTQQEVIDKLALQNAHAQIAIAKRSVAQNGNAARTAPSNVPQPATRKEISPEQVMQATVDLENPAKASTAVATLFEHATGIDPQRMILQQFAATAQAWQDETAAFYAHPGNFKLVTDQAKVLAGGSLARVTKEHLTQAFQWLDQQGYLIEEPINNPSQTLPPFPGESPVQRTERPRGARFATGTRSTSFRAPQTVQTRTLKYTEEQILKMPMSKSRELIRVGDKDYAEACEVYFGQKATA